MSFRITLRFAYIELFAIEIKDSFSVFKSTLNKAQKSLHYGNLICNETVKYDAQGQKRREEKLLCKITVESIVWYILNKYIL